MLASDEGGQRRFLYADALGSVVAQADGSGEGMDVYEPHGEAKVNGAGREVLIATMYLPAAQSPARFPRSFICAPKTARSDRQASRECTGKATPYYHTAQSASSAASRMDMTAAPILKGIAAGIPWPPSLYWILSRHEATTTLQPLTRCCNINAAFSRYAGFR